MQLDFFETIADRHENEGRKIMIGLSGGINSMAVLCYLNRYAGWDPGELHLFYAHFDEHSDDTLPFVLDGAKYAFRNFAGETMPEVDTTKDVYLKSKNGKVVFKMTHNSVNEFFIKNKMIPHPSNAACTRMLKILPMAEYMRDNDIFCDLVGYVRSERQRITKQQDRLKKKGEEKTKQYLISHLSDDDCFSLIEKEIGWYPKIYNLRWSDAGLKLFLLTENNIMRIPDGKDEIGNQLFAKNGTPVKNQRRIVRRLLNTNKQIFAHNNCLWCKNWQSWEQVVAEYFFPEKTKKALAVSGQLKTYWGRDTDQLDFGQSTCTFCAV